MRNNPSQGTVDNDKSVGVRHLGAPMNSLEGAGRKFTELRELSQGEE